ncbi:hypothetical protein D3C71_1395850 [compost metagenome]
MVDLKYEIYGSEFLVLKLMLSKGSDPIIRLRLQCRQSNTLHQFAVAAVFLIENIPDVERLYFRQQLQQCDGYGRGVIMGGIVADGCSPCYELDCRIECLKF